MGRSPGKFLQYLSASNHLCLRSTLEFYEVPYAHVRRRRKRCRFLRDRDFPQTAKTYTH